MTNKHGKSVKQTDGVGSNARAGFIGAILLVGMMTSVAIVGGCQKTALRPKDDRSQFDRYDQARNQKAQPFLEDEFGRRTPNLSERLLERND
ncbi:MAG: hypothetical protein P1U42_11400 [Phycisphaerales bacterium]|nr:hypothetical protein [Phycisphaerales bacterium]